MLEQALATFQGQVEESLDRVNSLSKRLKKLRGAAVAGDLREIDKSLAGLEDLAASLHSHAGGLAFSFDDANYFPDAFLREGMLHETTPLSGENIHREARSTRFARSG